MQFRSKIGSGIILISLLWMLLTLSSFVACAIFGLYVFSIIGVSVLIIFILPIFINTKYVIKNGYLYIHFGLFVHQAIPCYNIISITNAQTVSISPALSSIRLRIKYVSNGKIKGLYVSPVDQDNFRNMIEDEIQLNFKKAQISQDQVDLNELQKVIKKETKEQEKMDEQAYAEQQKQKENELKQNSLFMLKLEKRAKQSKINDYKAEQLKAVKQANAEIEAEILSEMKYEQGKENMQLKQFAELISLHDKQEKQERKEEYKRWAEEKKEKEKVEQARKKMEKRQKKERERLEKEARKNIELLNKSNKK